MSNDGRERHHTPRWAPADATAINDKNITHAEFRLLMALRLHMDNEGRCFPKELSIALNLGMTQGGLSKHLQNLVKQGYLRYSRERVEGYKYLRNVYYPDINKGVNLPPRRMKPTKAAPNHMPSEHVNHMPSEHIDANHMPLEHMPLKHMPLGHGINRSKELTQLSASVSALASGIKDKQKASPPKKKSTEQRQADREWQEQKRAQVDLDWLERQRREDEQRVAAYKELHAKLNAFDSRHSFRQRQLDRKAAEREARNEAAQVWDRNEAAP